MIRVAALACFTFGFAACAPVAVAPQGKPAATTSVPAWLRFAPYYAGQEATNVEDWMNTTGGKFLTLAFYNSGGDCTGAWEGYEPRLITLAEKLRATGGQVIVSSGGWNAQDIAASCADPQRIAEIYESVLTRLGTPYLDIDAEPGDINNNLAPAIVDRRAAALRILQDRFDAQSRPLHLSFTLAIRPAFGYDAENFYLLQAAKNAGVRFDVVNPMIMDYRDGVSGSHMGERSIMALEKGVAQMKTLLPNKTDAELWVMMAATAMLGQNDAEPEVFTLDDARRILEFARAKGMARLSFWSLDRDNGRCADKKEADSSCSGLKQETWAFSKIFADY